MGNNPDKLQRHCQNGSHKRRKPGRPRKPRKLLELAAAGEAVPVTRMSVSRWRRYRRREWLRAVAEWSDRLAEEIAAEEIAAEAKGKG